MPQTRSHGALRLATGTDGLLSGLLGLLFSVVQTMLARLALQDLTVKGEVIW
jgi:hypothetical protein